MLQKERVTFGDLQKWIKQEFFLLEEDKKSQYVKTVEHGGWIGLGQFRIPTWIGGPLRSADPCQSDQSYLLGLAKHSSFILFAFFFSPTRFPSIIYLFIEISPSNTLMYLFIQFMRQKLVFWWIENRDFKDSSKHTRFESLFVIHLTYAQKHVCFLSN